MKKIIRFLVCSIIVHSGLLRLLLRNERRGILRVLVYHQVNRVGRSISPRVSPERFARHMRLLKQNYRIVRLDKALPLLTQEDLPVRALAVTFDDGHADIAREALPVMEREGIFATVFVSAGLVEKRENSWTDIINHTAQRSGAREIEVMIEGRTRRYDIQTFVKKRKFCEEIERLMTVCPTAGRERMTAEIISRLGSVTIPPILLSWEDVRELDRRGWEIGSHTLSHTVLTGCSPDELQEEIVGSKELLEERLAVKISGFSYPSAAVDRTVRDAVERAKYSYAADVGGGINTKETDHFMVKRIHVENDPPEVFACRVHGILLRLEAIWRRRKK